MSSLAEKILKVLLKHRSADEDESKQNFDQNNYQPKIVLQIQTPHHIGLLENVLEPMTEEKVSEKHEHSNRRPVIKDKLIEDTAVTKLFADEENNDEPSSNWYHLWGSNWRQFAAVLPGIIFLMTIGSQFSLCISELDLMASNPKVFTGGVEVPSLTDDYHDYGVVRVFSRFLVLVAWYGGAILGSCVGAIFVPSQRKITIYFSSGLVLATSSALFLFGGFYELGARLLFGFAYGLVQLTVIVHVSDIATKEMRGAIVRKIAYLSAFSTVVCSFVIHTCGYEETVLKKYIAVQLLIFSIIGLILTPLLTQETVPYLLLHNRKRQAYTKLMNLHSERKPSQKTQRIFEELVLTVKEDKMAGKNIFGSSNIKPLLAITNAKLLDLLLYSVPMTLFIIKLYKGTPLEKISFPTSLFARNELIRILAGTLALFISSFIGGPRRVLYAVGALSFIVNWRITANLFFGYNSILHVQSTCIILAIAIVSTSVYTLQWLYITQAFSVVRKPWSIAFATLIKHLMHIVLIAVYCYVESKEVVFWILLSAGAFFIPIILLVLLPKSTKLSLRNVRNAWN